MKKFISCIFCTFLLSLNIFATITRDDLVKFLSKSDGGVIIENDYDVFPGYTVYTKESIVKIFISHDNSNNAYCYLHVNNTKYRISVSRAYYDESLNILYFYKML